MKKFFLLIVCFLLIPFKVYGTEANSPVGIVTYENCMKFQDSNISSSGAGYFGVCKKANCYTGTWSYTAMDSDPVRCTNGNFNQYIQTVKDGCPKGSCTPTTNSTYCTSVVYYDCSRTRDGSTYVKPTTSTTTVPTTKKTTTTTKKTTTTTKKTTTTTTKKSSSTTTTTTTTTKKVIDTNNSLKSLKLSEGEINFNKDTLNYTIYVNQGVKYIEVEAVPESATAKVVVENTTIKKDIPIKVTVTSEDGNSRMYLITVKYKSPEEVLSSDNTIKELTIKDYKINFDPNKNNYTVRIDENVKTLDIDVTLNDEKAKYVIEDNKDLKNNSKIKIIVTAEDGKENTYIVKTKYKNKYLYYALIAIVGGIIIAVAYKLIKGLIPAKKDSGYDYE